MRVLSRSSRADVEAVIRSLPAVLTGRTRDAHGIARGFKLRLAFSFLELVNESFREKSRGREDSAGDTWAPLSPQYLAYRRGTTGPHPPRAGKKSPGGKDGFMTPAELAQWRKIYATNLRRLLSHHEPKKAKGMAAARAWTAMKRQGVKTKLQVFGGRKAGVDYQILVDNGLLARSLEPGILSENGPDATYAVGGKQVVEPRTASVVVGTAVPYAIYHHGGKKKAGQKGKHQVERRLWPKSLPSEWWLHLLASARGGVMKIGRLAEGGRL